MLLARILLVPVALLVLAGCNEVDDSGATPGPTAGATTGASDPGSPSSTGGPSSSAAHGCPYLSADQVSEVLGTQLTLTAGSMHACFFDPPGSDDKGDDGPSVMLSRVDLQIDPTDYARQSKALCLGPVTELGVGDEAFACVAGLGPQGQLYAGRVLITVGVDDAADDAAGLAAAGALVKQVTIPPADR